MTPHEEARIKDELRIGDHDTDLIISSGKLNPFLQMLLWQKAELLELRRVGFRYGALRWRLPPKHWNRQQDNFEWHVRTLGNAVPEHMVHLLGPRSAPPTGDPNGW